MWGREGGVSLETTASEGLWRRESAVGQWVWLDKRQNGANFLRKQENSHVRKCQVEAGRRGHAGLDGFYSPFQPRMPGPRKRAGGAGGGENKTEL